MRTSSRPNASPSVTGMIACLLHWLIKLATRLLAHSLNMPEPLVHTTGVLVFAQVQAVETSIGRTFCPVWLWRRLQASMEASGRSPRR